MYVIEYKKTNCHLFLSMIMFVGFLLFFIDFSKDMYLPKIKKCFTDTEVQAYNVELNYTYANSENFKYYTPTYFYEVDGKEYKLESSKGSLYNPELMESKKTIYYKKENPEYAISEYETILHTIDKISLGILWGGIILLMYMFKQEFSLYKKLKKLQVNGTLFRDIPYTIVGPNDVKNNYLINTFMINFDIPGYGFKKLYGYPIFNDKTFETSKTVDLLIDIDDIKVRYMDFKIKEN